LGRRSHRVMTSAVDFVELEEEVRDLPAAEVLVLEEVTEDRVESRSARIDR
jgi:hypothetical protein